MADFDDTDGLLSLLIFAVPAAVLATLAVLVLQRARKNRKTKSEPFTALRVPSLSHEEEALESAADEPPLPRAVDEIKKNIDNAIADKPALAPLYLELSRAHKLRGEMTARMEALRLAAGHGAQYGPASAHGDARLELAEAAYDQGDLSSACEQWQLARTAYLEAKNDVAHARVDQRMRDHGCPTDWVLTDF